MQCCVVGCAGDPGPGIQGFYNFPEDNHRRVEWLNAIGRLEEEISVLSALCSSHFEADCFEFTSDGMLLKTAAVPVVNIIKREHEINNATDKLKQNIIVVSTATIRIEKQHGKTEGDCLNQIEKQSHLNNLNEIVKEYNSELLNKERLYILKSKPEKIKEDLDMIQSNGYNIHLQEACVEINQFFTDDIDKSLNNGYISDSGDTKDNIVFTETEVEISTNKDLERKTELKSLELSNLHPGSKNIIKSTLRNFIDSKTPKERYILIENIKKKQTGESVTIEPILNKKRRTKRLVKEYAPVSDTIQTQVLTLKQQVQRIADCLESSEFLNNPHKCYKCGISFQRIAHYRHHVMHHDKSYGPFECNVCNSYYPNKIMLGCHKRKRHLFVFRCKLCQFQTTTRPEAKLHICGTDGIKIYSCENCQLTFNNRYSYTHHMHKRHKSDDYTCSLCGAKFSNPQGLRHHHSICKRRIWECQVCLRKFRGEYELKLHQQSTSQVCVRPTDVVPQQESYRCEECDLDLFSRRSYLLHMNKKHRPEGGWPFRCEECNIDFKTKVIHDRHFQKATKHRKPEAFRFQCEQCSAVYVTKIELMEHQQLHTNEKLYRCQKCDKTFGRSAIYWKHKHHSVSCGTARIHPCTHCHRRFKTNDKLQIHIRSHTCEISL